MSIDLHCHTLFSVDGFGPPEKFVEVAAGRGLTAMSITEHNHLGSLERAAACAEANGVRYFPGIELDAFYGERSYHFLGYGFDPSDEGLNRLAARNHACYPNRFEIYYGKLEEMGFPVTREDIAAYMEERYTSHPAPVPNTWALGAIVAGMGAIPGYEEMRKAAQQSLSARIREEAESQGTPGENILRFCRFEEARDAIRGAGGIVLFAHPGKALPGDADAQEAMVRRLMDEGVDGFELYHWANASQSDFGQLEQLARELGCVVSGGSDCHDAPGEPPKELGTCGAPDDVADKLAEALAAST